MAEDIQIRAGSGSVLIRDGRIASMDSALANDVVRTLDLGNAMLLPGLIDLHAHPALSGSVFGVDPDRHMLPRGVTSVLSQGDAGSDNIQDYLNETVRTSQTRVVVAINLSRVGESTTAGCLSNLDDADVDSCIAVVAEHRKHIWGIALNISHLACGDSDPREMLRRGLLAANETGLPILFGMRRAADLPFEEQLAPLRPGDVVTYCFRREPHCIVENGRVDPAVWAARERGVLFDVGHGAGSFCFEVAETAIAEGFLPHTVSTDLQLRHLDQTPTHDLPLVMSKLRAAGMSTPDIIQAVTETPATILGRHDEIGQLKPGMCADLTALQWNDQATSLMDTQGNSRQGGYWTTALTLREGRVIAKDGTITSR